MNKHIICTGIIALIFPLLVNAQQETEYTGEIKIIPKELVQRGDSLYVRLNINMNKTGVSHNRSVTIIPMLSDGVQSKDLPGVMILGKRKYKEYIRKVALMGEKEKAEYLRPYIIEKADKKQDKVIEYKYVIPFESWIKKAWLGTKTDLCGCNTTSQLAVERLVDNVLLDKEEKPFVFKPYLTYIQAEIEIEKQRVIQEEAFLDFAAGKTDIRLEYGNNLQELTRIRTMIEGIRKEKGVRIKGIDITGYASPEGALSLNKALSEGRAKALQEYLQNRYDLPYSAYTIHFGGEDWDGLVRLVERSEIQSKELILAIIKEYSIDMGRKKKLMELNGGMSYRYMLETMYPSLRRVVCKVNYDVKSFNVEEAKEVIKTRPQNLSLYEMYAIANTYSEDSQQYSDIFELAVRMYPEDETANLNAAIATLKRKDTLSAERYLKEVRNKTNTPEYNNAMGVLMVMKGDYEKAASFFRLAANRLSAGSSNLDQLLKAGLIGTKR